MFAPQAAATPETGIPATVANRAGKPARRGLPVEIRRMMGLETAADMLGGQGALADALGITVRGLRAKVSADRGISTADLLAAAMALDAQAIRILDHARKLRAEAGAA